MKILILETCRNPRECRLCLDRCPEKVFGIYPRQRRRPGTPAGDWVITPLFPSQCNGCRECEAFCPQHAISVLNDKSRKKEDAQVGVLG